jgi:hypothetical protein
MAHYLLSCHRQKKKKKDEKTLVSSIFSTIRDRETGGFFSDGGFTIPPPRPARETNHKKSKRN